jgi:hypothetical protein
MSLARAERHGISSHPRESATLTVAPSTTPTMAPQVMLRDMALLVCIVGTRLGLQDLHPSGHIPLRITVP